MHTDIKELRQEIDRIDDQIKTLFEQRMTLALDIGKIKAEKSLPVQDAARENEIISRLTANQDDDMVTCTKALFTAILKASRSYQTKKLGSQQ